MLVMEYAGSTLLTRHSADGYIPGQWGLPTETLPKGGRPLVIARELSRKLLGKRIQLKPCQPVRHAITHRRILAHIFRADLDERQPVGSTAGNSVMWINHGELDRFIISSFYRKSIRSAWGGEESTSSIRLLKR